MQAPELLYHFTCHDHGAIGIERTGELRPNGHPWITNRYGKVVWLTDVGDFALAGAATGMHSPQTLSCDRLAVRYTVFRDDVAGLVWWPDIRERFAPQHVAQFEAGAMPSRWWVTRHPVPLRSFG